MFFGKFILYCMLAVSITGAAAKDSYCYSSDQSQQIAWKCNQKLGNCTRTRVEDSINEVNCLTSLNVCKLICNEYGSLWPLPTGIVDIGKRLTPVNAGSITFIFKIPGSSLWSMLNALEHYFLDVIRHLFPNYGEKKEEGLDLKIIFEVADEEAKYFTYNVSERYSLKISTTENTVNVVIESDTYLGVRHGAETLLQMIVLDELTNTLVIPTVAHVTDQPIYKHRGILLDTSRNFYSVISIKRMLDAMASNKLNTFHWHLTDTHSFPFVSRNYPQMAAYGAYSQSQVYTWSDIKQIVEYSKIRGIRVVPEIDTPAHVGEGWLHFQKDVLLCFKAEPWSRYCVEPSCGILNPVEEKVYEILKNLYAEMNELFESDIFHMGGDEIKYTCWNETESIVKWFADRNLSRNAESFLHLWVAFQNQALIEFDKSVYTPYKPKIVLWTSLLTEDKSVKEFLDPHRYIIQIWTTGRDKQIVDLLNHGYDLIISNYDALYFDCGFGAWITEGNSWCSPYTGWREVYMNSLDQMVTSLNETYRVNRAYYQKQMLGAEATLWSEQSDANTLDSRLWPRASAMAERLWSNPKTDWRKAESRLFVQRERMVARNIGADVLQPLWCHHNEGLCHI